MICLLTGFVWVSCTKTPVFQESLVPEIISISSIPETHSAILISDLNTIPYGRIECGFYIGTDKTNLKRLPTAISGRSFTLLMEDLQDGTTYYFKAFISNGINEIASGFESFMTEKEPVPEIPEEPVVPDNPTEPEQPENPSEPENPEQPTEPENPEEPENPDNPTDPEQPEEPTDPEEPENPEQPEEPTEPEEPGQPEEPVEFTTEIASVSAAVNDYIAELTAELSGDVSLVTECWFMAGYTPDKLSKIKGTLEGTAAKAYLAGLEPGTYWYKAVISNGTETRNRKFFHSASKQCHIKTYLNSHFCFQKWKRNTAAEWPPRLISKRFRW